MWKNICGKKLTSFNHIHYLSKLKSNQMKIDIFNQYADRVSNLFSIDQGEIFKKNKRRDIVDARHLLYYLCYKRPMSIRYIQNYMQQRGYVISHSSIIYGINTVIERIKSDSDYMQVVKDIEKAVFI